MREWNVLKHRGSGYLVFSKVAAPMRLAEGVPTFSARKLEEAFAFASDERSIKIKE